MNPLSLSESALLDSAFHHRKSERGHDLLRGALLWAALTIIPTVSAAAASGPPAGAGGGTLNVQGVVEVLNDTLIQPFRQSRINPDVAVGSATTPIPFDVPLGKRLIVEGITVLARVAPGQKALVQGRISGTQGGTAGIDITLKFQGTFNGQDVFSATAPLTLRVDGTVVPDELAFVMVRNGNSGPAFLSVSVFGYLVDSPFIN
jgi:hypothetical protein